MTLQPFEAAIESWALAITGLPRVRWEDAPYFDTDPVVVTLAHTAIARVGGEDSTPYVYDPDAVDPLVEMVPEVHGWRILTVTMSLETRHHGPTLSGRALLETARAQARKPSNLAILQAAGLAWVSSSNVIAAHYPLQGRVQSRYTWDVRLAAGFIDVDAAGATARIADADVQYVEP